MKPKEFAKKELGKLPLMKLVVGNHTGQVTSTDMVYNMKRETRRAKRQKMGILTQEDTSNILRAIEKTEQLDLSSRKASNDHSAVLPGIVRTVVLHPIPNIYFHSRSMLNLAAEIAHHGRLVVGIDGSGNMLNIKESKFNGKFQHLIITLQPNECLLTRNEAVNYSSNLFHPVIIAERISPSNKTSDVSSWVQVLRQDTKLATRSVSNKSLDLIPAVIKFDCAMELLNGTLAGFRSDCHVSNGEMYNNVVMVLLIQHECELNSICNSGVAGPELEQKADELAISIHKKMTTYSPSIMYWCNVHVYNAMRYYRKNKKNPPIELFQHKHQFDQILAYLADEMKTVKSISLAIVRLSIIAAIFDTEFIPCESLDERSRVHEHHDKSISERFAIRMNEIAKEESIKMLLDKRWQGVEFIDAEFSEMKQQKHGSSINFKGKNVGMPIVERMKKDMLFGISYLNAIDHASNTGKVNVCIVYSCYETNHDGVESVKPKRVGGFVVDVMLPHTSGFVRNPLYSPSTAAYIVDYWMNRIGLWVAPIMEITQRALNARIYTNNQGVEGTFNYEKHHVSTFHQDVADIASLIHRRYEDNLENGRMLRTQIGQSRLIIEARKKRRKMKKNEPLPSVNEPNDIEESDMQWRHNSKTIEAELQRWIVKMNSALERAKTSGIIGSDYKEHVRLSKWNILDAYAARKDTSFMSYQTFNTWLAGKRKTKLQKVWRDVIDSFAEDVSSHNINATKKTTPKTNKSKKRKAQTKAKVSIDSDPLVQGQESEQKEDGWSLSHLSFAKAWKGMLGSMYRGDEGNEH